MVEGEGFEPSKAEPSDLQSDPFGHSGTPPQNFLLQTLKHLAVFKFTADLTYITSIKVTHDDWDKMVEGEGFEPSKAEPSDLQSDPFGHSGTPPRISQQISQSCRTNFSANGGGRRIRTFEG